MGNKKSIGLPSGPNEFLKDITQHISVEGYKRYSEDVNNPYNIIESGNITMEDVDFPVKGTDNLGNEQIMMPGNNYQFPGDSVLEVPMAQEGNGERKKITDIKANPKELDYKRGANGEESKAWQYYDEGGNHALEDEVYGPIINRLYKGSRKMWDPTGQTGKDIYDKLTHVGDAADGQPRILPQPDPYLLSLLDRIKELPDSDIENIMDTDLSNINIFNAVGKLKKVLPKDMGVKEAWHHYKQLKKYIDAGYNFKEGGSIPMAQTGFEVPKRQGVRDNGDGSESTHLMATETLDGKNWFSFPTLFQDPDGTWIDMSTKPWKEAYKEAERRGELIDFGTDKESAIKFGEGSWKPKAQDGNGEYKVQKGDTFYGIANKNNVSWDTLKEANPNVNIESLGLNQSIVIPKAIDRSPAMPENQVDNSNVLDYKSISNYLVDSRGGTMDTWGQLADTIAFHESSPWSRMDPKAKQYKGGPGRGLFQFEGESFNTALKRYKNVAAAKGYTLKDSIVNAKSADELSSEDQYALFYANLIESKTKLSDFVDGNISSLDVWLSGHKNVEADGDRNSFLESKAAAQKEGIKNGYKTFQEGGEKYKVSSGDNLGKIANKYKTSVDELVRLNNIADPNKISINQELIVPEIPEESTLNKYTIKSGDTLGKLATKYNTSVNQLAALNNIKDVNKISIDQELILPDSYREEKPLKEESWYNVDDIQKNNNKVNDLTDENIIINSQLLNNPNQSYVVIDKKTQRLKLYRGDEVDLDFEVLTGANDGDAQTVTNVIDYNKDGITTEADKRGGKYKTDWMAGNRSTGAGVYTINQSAPTSENRYQNAPSFNLLNESGIQVGTSIHGTPGFRNKFFDDGNLENNSASNGCINGKCSDLQALYNMNLPTGTPVFILPEDEGNSFQQVDGKAVMRMSSKNRKDYLEYTDLRGDEQEGQGGNYSTSTLSYKPIRAKLDKELFEEKVYSAFDFNDDEEFNNTTQPFISALEKNKKDIMLAAQIPGDVYNQIAKMAFGIYGTESNFGDTHSAAGNLGRAATKYLDREGSSSPDIVSKYDTYNVQGDNNSVGYTQIRWSQLNDKEKSALKSFDITSNKDFLNPEKSAIATATILGIRYNEQLTADQKKDVWKNLPSKWNNRSNYSSRVKSNSRYLQFEQLDRLKKGGEIENNIMYKNYIDGVYTGSKMESKAEKIYDKLNRLHYRDAKAKQMTPANYVLTHVIG